jgi:hypothetical protein
MANFLENLGLGFFMENEEAMLRLLSLVSREGIPINGYGNTTYINYHYGNAQLIARGISNADEQIEIVGLDTHSRGLCVWNVRLSGFDLTPKDADAAQRYCVLKRAEDGSGMAVAHIVNADVLPSFLEDDFVKLQMIGFGVNFHYFADEDEYNESIEEDENGERWFTSDGTIMSAGLMLNHDPGRDESEKDYDLDTLVLLRGTVKKLLWGELDFEGNKYNGYIRCYVDTQFGELELIHTIEQVDEAERKKMKDGATISGLFVLSGDAGIYEYQNGAIYDEEHNLRLLRYFFIKGNAERTRNAFAEDAKYISGALEKEFTGRDNIIELFRFVYDSHADNGKKYSAYMATIINVDEDDVEPPEYPPGKRCMVLYDELSKRYESIVFIDTNESGKITKLSFSVDSRYHFNIDKAPKNPSVFDYAEAPENVTVPIINQARFYGFIDDTVADEEITDNLSEYRSYKFNADKMISALDEADIDDKEDALKHIFGYLFAKETERYVNTIRFSGDSGLLISYAPADALDGELRSRLSPDEHLALTGVMNRASQFYKDYCFFAENFATESIHEDDLQKALITVQRIGYLYGEKFLETVVANISEDQSHE